MGRNNTAKAAMFYNAFRASQKIPDAWDAWRGYREQVTDYIMQNSYPGTSLAVFGAGRMNDLSLQRLLGHFSQVTLFDVDEEAMWEAVSRDKGFFCEDDIKLVLMDFVGISDEDYIAFADALLDMEENLYFGNLEACEKQGLQCHQKHARNVHRNLEISEKQALQCCKLVENALEQMYAKSRTYIPKLPQEKYDYTIALGVHSQLGNVPAWLLNAGEAYGAQEKGTYRERGENHAGGCDVFLGENGEKMRGSRKGREEKWQKRKENLLARMEEESAFFSERLNELILSSTKRKAFIGCEVSRAVCENGVWYALPDTAVSGAWQAIEDIRRRAGRGEISFENYLDIVWPFSLAENKAYRMMVMEVEGRK